ILTLGKESNRAARNERKRLIAECFQWGDRARCDRSDGFCTAFPKFLRAHRMHYGRRTGRPHRLAQERGLFTIAFNKMSSRARLPSERAGDDQAREATAGAEVDPGPRLWRQ